MSPAGVTGMWATAWRCYVQLCAPSICSQSSLSLPKQVDKASEPDAQEPYESQDKTFCTERWKSKGIKKKKVSLSNIWQETKVHLHLFSGLFASNHVSMYLPCFHACHAPFCRNPLASESNSKLQAGICKCTRCGSCTAPTGINGVSTGSANGGRRPKIIPLRNKLVWLTSSAMTLGGQRNFGKAALGTAIFKPAWQQKTKKRLQQ